MYADGKDHGATYALSISEQNNLFIIIDKRY